MVEAMRLAVKGGIWYDSWNIFGAHVVKDRIAALKNSHIVPAFHVSVFLSAFFRFGLVFAVFLSGPSLTARMYANMLSTTSIMLI